MLTRVFFLYNTSTLEHQNLIKMIDKIKNQEVSAVFFVALKQQPDGDPPEEFFGAPFSVQPSNTVPPKVPRIVSGGSLREGMISAGYSAVNMVAPKKWKTIGERNSDLYIALDKPIEGLNHIILVITYDLNKSENKE